MATTTEAIKRIAEVTGLPVAHVDRFARILKRHKSNPWPRSGQGGGSKAAQVEPRHLTNLAIVLVVADPITSGPERLSVFRSLPVHTNGQYCRGGENFKVLEPVPEGAQDSLFTGANLGEMFDAIVENLARLILQKSPLVKIYEGSLEATFTIDGTPHVFLHAETIVHGSVIGSAIEFCWEKKWSTNKTTAPLTRLVHVSFNLFKTLAELWIDTLAYKATTPLPSVSAAATAGQKNENAGDLCHKVPAPSKNQPRANGAELSDHPRANGSGGLKGLPEGICEKKDFQGCACQAGADHSLTSPSGVEHARPRSYPAPASCA